MSIFYLITTVGKRGKKTVQAMALVAFACSSWVKMSRQFVVGWISKKRRQSIERQMGTAYHKPILKCVIFASSISACILGKQIIGLHASK